LLAGIAVSPMVLYRMIRHNRYRAGWTQRFGRVSRKKPEKKCLWIHAVSVGEVNATVTLITELQKRFPDIEIIISTTTDTGYARAKALYGDRLTVFYFPLDFSCIRRKVFRNLKPSLCLFMELEVWPNFVFIAYKLNIPVAISNGRITERSSSRYALIKPIAKMIFSKLDLVLAQTDLYAQRFKAVGVSEDKVVVIPSIKYDTAQVSDKIEGADELAQKINIQNERLWVAGGTGTDEEKILIDVYKKLLQQEQFKDLRFVIVPRKPERFKEVAEQIEQNGFDCLRYSRYKQADISAPKTDSNTIILSDTMGDLRKFYSLATLVFVGRSFVPLGGSDMIESAALGKCTMFGPLTFNFAQSVEALLADNGAIEVKNAEELLSAIQKCLTEPEYAEKIAQNGKNVIIKNQGATQKTIDQIEKFLKDRK
jgi:3-deoxy-D-manno-octulosonic-acid transferase